VRRCVTNPRCGSNRKGHLGAIAMRLLVPLTTDRALAKAPVMVVGVVALLRLSTRASCDSHLACAAPAAAGRERLKKGMPCW